MEFRGSTVFNFADSWGVGSFKAKPYEGLMPKLVEHLDIPCWPELTALGDEEELVGFWLSLYLDWDENSSDQMIEERLKSRPGIQAVAQQFAGQPIPVLKGQMIGPVTLLWAMKRKEVMVIDRDRVLEFIRRAFLIQNTLLRHYANEVIVSLDEPCAFLEKSAARIWEDFFERLSIEEAFGVALHSCGEVFEEIFKFPWDVVHVDLKELEAAVDQKPMLTERLHEFNQSGGWIALGAVSSSALNIVEDDEEVADRCVKLIKYLSLSNVLVSTSCGLDERSMEATIQKLEDVGRLSNRLVEKIGDVL